MLFRSGIPFHRGKPLRLHPSDERGDRRDVSLGLTEKAARRHRPEPLVIGRPRVVVDYEREPYIMEAGDVRITFDKNVRAGVQDFDIFDTQMPTVETIEPGLLILEVKYTEFLPNVIRDILKSNPGDYLAVSKFILCCDKTIHKQFSHF